MAARFTLSPRAAASALALLAVLAVATGSHTLRARASRVMDAAAPAASAATPRLSPERAMALALNELAPADGGWTVVHPRHTVRFDAAGVTFAARRGPEWRWRLRGTAPVTPTVRDGDVLYAREGFVERWRPGAAGIEQDFVLAAAPARGADVVIEGDVTCGGALEAHARGWLWRDAAGVVSLGHVKVVDAAGRTIPARMQVEPGATRIVVEGGALASAAFPVTVDPEVGTNDFRVSAMGMDGDRTYDARRAAVAYNATNAEYLVVWEGDDDVPGGGEGQFEIYGQRVSAATGLPVGTNDFRISDMGADGDPNSDATRPAVAWNATNNEYLVVWSGDDSTGVTVNGEFEIFGQRLAGATGAELGTNDFRISDMGPNFDPAYDAEAPAVAWNAAVNEYVVVWEGDDNTFPLVNGESEIFAQRLAGATGAELGANDFRVSDMGADGVTTAGAHTPAIAYAGGAAAYLVVWSGDDGVAPLVNDEFEIFGQRLAGATAAALGANDFRISDMGADGDSTYDADAPSLAYGATDDVWFVAWSGDDVLPGLAEGEREIFGQLIAASTGAAVGPNDARYSDMGPDGDPIYDAFAPSVAYDSVTREFLVAWEGDDKGGGLTAGEFELFGQLVSAQTGAESRTNDFQMSDMGIPGHVNVGGFSPAACARTNGTIEYFVAWHADQDTLGLVDDEFEVYSQRLTGQGRDTGPEDQRLSDAGPDGDVDYDARFPQAAYDPFTMEYLVVWEADDTTGTLVDGETEIFGRRVSALSGAVAGPLQFRISHMGPDGDAAYDAQDAAVAFDDVRRRWLVVWAGETNFAPRVNGEFEIHGQLLAENGTPIGASGFRISDMGGDGDALTDANHPRVAFDSNRGEWLVVWDGDDTGGPTVEGELEIFGQRLDGDGLEIGANDFRISDMGFDGDAAFDAGDPAVTWNPARDEYLVVWAADDSSAVRREGETEIFAQRLSGDGLEVGANDFRVSSMGPDSDPLFDASKPAVACAAALDQYVVVWEGDDLTVATAEGEQEIWAQRLSGDGSEIGLDDFRVSDMGPDGSPLFDAASPAVTWVPAENEYLVTWGGDDDAFPLVDGEAEIFGQRLDASTGLEVDVNDVRLSDAGPDGDGRFDASHPAVVHSAALHRSLVVWMADDDTGALHPSEYEIWAQAFANNPNVGVGDGPAAPRAAFALELRGVQPARGSARLALASDVAGTFDVSVHDVAGRRVSRQGVTFAAPGRVELSLDARTIPPGIYLVRASGAHRTATRKLVIAR